MRSGVVRDRVAAMEGVIVFEMEAAVMWDAVPFLVVKGVYDYADGHKNKRWQAYASATAASVAKAILILHTPTEKPVAADIGFRNLDRLDILDWRDREGFL